MIHYCNLIALSESASDELAHSFLAKDVCVRGRWNKDVWIGQPREHVEAFFKRWGMHLFQGVDVAPPGEKSHETIVVQVRASNENAPLRISSCVAPIQTPHIRPSSRGWTRIFGGRIEFFSGREAYQGLNVRVVKIIRKLLGGELNSPVAGRLNKGLTSASSPLSQAQHWQNVFVFAERPWPPPPGALANKAGVVDEAASSVPRSVEGEWTLEVEGEPEKWKSKPVYGPRI
eukprot:1194746-Prorocentrum_minimum.AAC.1